MSDQPKRPRGRPRLTLDRRVHVRISSADEEEWTQLAQEEDRDLGPWIRHAVKTFLRLRRLADREVAAASLLVRAQVGSRDE